MEKNVEYYLSKGIERKVAEYFAAGRRQIISVTPNDNFSLTIGFDSGEQRLYDMRPFLKSGTVFEPLMDLSTFRRVYLDNNHCISWDIDPAVDSEVVWNNKVDLCPDCCYVDSVPIDGGTSHAG